MKTLESVVRNDARLTLLGNLAYGGPCNAKELAKRTGHTITEVAYHVAVLRSHDLVGRDDEDEVYVATLSDRPEWVEEAVTAHRLALRIALGLPESAGLKVTCTFCDRLLQFKERIVAVYHDGESVRARVVAEGLPGGGEADELRASEKYHPACYEKARRGGRTLPHIGTRS